MTSHEFENNEVELLTALRSHIVRGLKMNFSSWYKPNLMCRLNCQNSKQDQQEDSQQHLLLCQALLNQLTTEQQEDVQGISYNDIYADLACQKLAVRGFSILLDVRERLLEAVTPASAVGYHWSLLLFQGATGDYHSTQNTLLSGILRKARKA